MVTKIIYHCNNEVVEWQWASDNEKMPYPYWTSCFLVDGLLIDCGAPGGEKDLKKFLNSLPDEKQIDKCVITHAHEDHAGGANMLQNELNIPIFASKKALEKLRKGNSYPDYRQFAWGEKLLPSNASTLLEPIETRFRKYKLDIFPMEGHAPELIALIERKQEWAFVADAVQPRYKMLFGNTSDIQENIQQIYLALKSLDKFTEGLNNLKLFVAGAGLLEGRKTLKEKIKELEELHLRAHQFYKKYKSQDIPEISALRKVLREMFTKEGMIGQLTRGDLSIMNLIKSLLAWPIER